MKFKKYIWRHFKVISDEAEMFSISIEINNTFILSQHYSTLFKVFIMNCLHY